MNKSTDLFELIHNNVWGPILVLSHSVHKYYIHFLDDYTKFSWYFVLKSRSNILQVFRAFRLQIENLFRRKINFLQSDAVEEFLSHDFQLEL